MCERRSHGSVSRLHHSKTFNFTGERSQLHAVLVGHLRKDAQNAQMQPRDCFCGGSG
jgi:hypothetical protein